MAAAPIAFGPTPLRTELDLRIEPERLAVRGHERLTVRNTTDRPLDELYLRLWANAAPLARGGASASISNARAGAGQLDVQLDRTVARLGLPRPLAPGAQTTVEFDFEAVLPKRIGRMGTDPATGTMYFGNALPALAVHDDEGWNLDPYSPVTDGFYALAGDVRARITAPEGITVVTTGHETAPAEASRGTRTISVAADKVRDFAMVAGRDLVEHTRTVDGTRVRVFTPAADAHKAPGMLDNAASALSAFNARFGAFGYPELDVVDAPGTRGGMEYPTLVLADGTTPDYTLADVVTHEVAHQWFYGLVGNNQFDDPWLDESITTWVARDYLGRTQPLPPDSLEPVHISSPVPVLMSGAQYVAKTYYDGAWAVNELRSHIGREAFDRGMRSWVDTHRHGVATTADFVDTMSAAAGRDLTGWFAEHGIHRREPAADRKLDPNGSVKLPDAASH